MHENRKPDESNYFGDSLNDDAPANSGGEFTDFVEQRAFEPEAGVTGSGKLKISRANMLLIGLFALGIGCVYFLSLRNGPTEANAQNQAMEMQVDQFIADARAGQDPIDAEGRQIIETFYRDLTRRQVPLDDLRANPFVFERPTGPEGEVIETEASITQAELEHRRRMREVEREFQQLTLQSIMFSSRGGTAIVDNDLLRPGQQFGSFTVEEITPNTVLLRWEDQTYTLRMVD